MWRTGEAMIRVWSTGSILTRRNKAQATWSTGALVQERRKKDSQTSPRDRKKVSIKWRIPRSERIRLIESTKRSTCDRLNKRHSELSGKREVRKASSEIHAKSEERSATTSSALPHSASTQIG